MFGLFKKKRYVSPVFKIRPTTTGAVDLAKIYDLPQSQERNTRFWRKVSEIASQECEDFNQIQTYLRIGSTFYFFGTRLEVYYERTTSGWLFYTKG